MNYQCFSCEYLWVKRKKVGSPAKCPACNSKKIAVLLPPIQPYLHPRFSGPKTCLLCDNDVEKDELRLAFWLNFQQRGYICEDCFKDILSKGKKDEAILSEFLDRLPFITDICAELFQSDISYVLVYLETDNRPRSVRLSQDKSFKKIYLYLTPELIY